MNTGELMQVVTPGSVARHTGSKYLGVLVAAKHARELNELRRGEMISEDAEVTERREKLTTTALRSVADGAVEYRMVPRREPEL
jgi:DNA-directed RNA polymerase omega subunit